MKRNKVFNGQNLLLLVFIFGLSMPLSGDTLRNPSFEEDYENDGVPDGWDIPKTTKVKLVSNATDGIKAALFSEGYILVSQNLCINKPAGKVLKVAMDVAGFNGAKLGVIVGYMHKRPDGSKRWINHKLTWNRNLKRDYSTIALEHNISKEAIGSRVWIAIYRTNGTGSILLDNIQLVIGNISPEKQKIVNRLLRELGYLKSKCKLAEKRIGKTAKLEKIKREVNLLSSKCFATDDDEAVDKIKRETNPKLPVLSAEMLRLLYPNKDLLASFADPFTRLNPAELPPENIETNFEINSLQGEYQSAGLILTNCQETSVKCKISITGLDIKKFNVKVRKQVFLETWYKREKERIADPLPLLPKEGNSWYVDIKGGQTIKLYLGFHIPDDISGIVKANINITQPSNTESITLPLTFNIASAKLPTKPEFNHLAFVYTTSNVAFHSSELCAKDLIEHYVTVMEFPYVPKSTFSPNGEIVAIDFSLHDKLVRTYAPFINLMIFWQGSWGFKCSDGRKLKFMSKEWKSAYTNLLQSWLKHYTELGFEANCFSILPIDEPSSANYKNAPDKRVVDAVVIFKLTRSIAPKLPIILTLSDYAFPADVKMMIPYVDVVLPLWPYRTKLLRNAPADYNPRKTYREVIYPMLDAQRKKTGMQIWSYHIAAGKSDKVLVFNRAYPILAVASGLTGVATWAYNVSRGSTWDDTDGGLLDYIFVYDGTENHPINKKVNPTGEVIVPSIRWEALRAGIQDAKILLHLKTILAEGKFDPQQKLAVQQLIAEANRMNENKFRINAKRIVVFARNIRDVYVKVTNEN